MPWKDKMPHLELCLKLLFKKRITNDFFVTFILILHGVRIERILNYNIYHRTSDPDTFYEKELIYISRPGGVVYSCRQFVDGSQTHAVFDCFTFFSITHTFNGRPPIVFGIVM